MDKKEIDKHLPLVKSIASKYIHSTIPFEDLIQEGTIGLWEAWQRYDPEKDAKFSTYATYWIKKRILEAVGKEYDASLDAAQYNDEISYHKRENTEEIENYERINFPTSFPDKEKKVLILLYGLDGNGSYDLGEIGEKLGIPRERVRQLKEKGLRRLRKLGIELT